MELAEQAVALDVQARHHKRESQLHKRAARDGRGRQAEGEAKGRALGIEIVYREGDKPWRNHYSTSPR